MPIIGKHRCQARTLRRAGREEGFTLIELLVVLLIIGILLAIAIPTFLAVTKGASNTAAQSNLQNALTGAKVFYTDNGQTYSNVNVASASISDIQQIDTGLNFYSTASTAVQMVSLYVPTSGAAAGTYLILTAFSPGQNDCWGILDIPITQAVPVQGKTQTGTYFFVEKASGATACIASAYAVTVASTVSTSGFPAP